MIVAKSVSKWYGSVRALSDVSFEVPRGQIVGLLGPNGAGKTTTIRITTGFLPPSTGTVQVCGHDVVDDSLAARRSIGYLPENAPLYPEMSVDGYLDFRARLYGLGRSERKAAAGRAIDRCRLNDVRSRRVGQLSKGYKQRVGLAAAMLHDPAVLILDEPTTGLDPSQIREARRLIRELAENRTVLVSSHILPEVELTCDRVLIIAGGAIRADGSPSQLVAGLAPEAPYIVEVDALPFGGAAKAAESLQRIAGAAGAKLETGPDTNGKWARVIVTPAAGTADLREPIARTALAAGATIRELHRQAATLEQLFLRVVEGDQGGAGVPPASAEARP